MCRPTNGVAWTSEFLKKESIRESPGQDYQILGITEVENENPVDTLIKFLKDYLNVSCMLSEIDTVFRVNRAIGTDSSPQPRVLLATFTSVLKKHAVMSADKAKLKGTKS
nr:unnamed protein product [Callosobruchus chinensis]